MSDENKIETPEEIKQFLRAQGKRGGQSTYAKHGKEQMAEMGRQRWIKHPSKKMRAYRKAIAAGKVDNSPSDKE